MKKKIKIILLILLFFTAVLTIKNNNIKAATYGHYTYEENGDGTITITKYDGTAAENLVIPSTINGMAIYVNILPILASIYIILLNTFNFLCLSFSIIFFPPLFDKNNDNIRY